MKFNKIHHVAIICSDYSRSKNFYVSILGAQVIVENYRPERNSYKLDLSIADSRIELFSFINSPKRLSQPEACGLRHIAFEVDSVEEVVEVLNNNGVVTENVRVDEYTGKKFTFFKDPDGLPIEIYQL